MYIIKEMPRNERPRERFLKYGKSALSEKELLAIILRTGTSALNVLDMANMVLKKFETIKSLNACEVSDLTKIRGLGPTKAIQILAALELGKRLYDEKQLTVKQTFNNPKTVYQYMRSKIEMEKQENFYAIYLDTKGQLLKAVKIYVGTLNSAIVHPREIFKHAVSLSAASIIIVHNHPSGDPHPSNSDEAITKILIKNGKLMDIPIVDHIIVGDGQYYSFKEHRKF